MNHCFGYQGAQRFGDNAMQNYPQAQTQIRSSSEAAMREKDENNRRVSPGMPAQAMYPGGIAPTSIMGQAIAAQQACDGGASRRPPVAKALDNLEHSVYSLRDRFEILVQRLAPIMPPTGPTCEDAPGDNPRCQESELSERLRNYEARIRSIELWMVDIIGRIEV